MDIFKTPDVYIREFEPAAPITGVGTGTAAFLGPCLGGPLNEPTKVTSWDEFKRVFGSRPVPNQYLWYGVRGFYQNGGVDCFVTRVSNAAFGELVLNDVDGKPTLVARARRAGALPSPITVAIDDNVRSVSETSAKLFRPTGKIANAAAGTRIVTLTLATDAEKFRPGDRITWASVAPDDDRALIMRVNGSALEIEKPLSKTYTTGNLRLANLPKDTGTLRLEGAAKVEPGMVLLLSQTTPAPVSETVTVQSVIAERISPTLTTWRVTLRKGLAKGFDLGGGQVTVRSHEFRLTITKDGVPTVYDELGMDPDHPRYFGKVVNGIDPDIVLSPVDPPNTTAPPNNRPATASAALAGGADDDLSTLTAAQYIAAIDALEAIDNVNMIAVPDRQDKAVQDKLLEHCEQRMRERFAVLDTPRGLQPYGTGSALTHRAGLVSHGGFGAIYYPWIQVFNERGTDLVLVPPSGSVMGIYARTDQSRGVHKAPAGLAANVRGAVGVERLVTAEEQGDLNLEGVNVLRILAAGAPPTVWGARTLASGQNGNPNWQYVNIRRLFLYLEESIQEGLRGAVFEPNNLSLWQRLKRTLTDFLTREWRAGAMFGEKASDAFYVRIDEVLNPFSEQQLGRLHIEIGIRPTYPAEFIIVRIGIWDGGSQVDES